MDPKISVIIPIYNMEAYLARCLDSVLNNTYRNLEVICVDDGSTDSSPEILRRYEVADPRIVVITKKNGGVSSARNAGLDRMTGEYVCFIDPDDFVHPQYVELLFQALLESGTDISICSFHTISEDEIPEPPVSYTFDPSSVHKASFNQVFKNHDLRTYCWGRLFRRELAAVVRFHSGLKYVEDSLFFAQVCEGMGTTEIAVVSLPLYYYVNREGSLTKEATSQDRMQIIKAFVDALLSSDHRDDIYLDQTIKRGLSSRYMSISIYPDRNAAKEYTRLLKDLQKRFRKADFYSFREKVRYSVFILFPVVYWAFRSIKEPYMWKWERIERRKRREAKRTIPSSH